MIGQHGLWLISNSGCEFRANSGDTTLNSEFIWRDKYDVSRITQNYHAKIERLELLKSVPGTYAVTTWQGKLAYLADIYQDDTYLNQLLLDEGLAAAIE